MGGIEGLPETPGPLPRQMPDAEGDGHDTKDGKNPCVPPAMQYETTDERKSAHDQHKETSDVVHAENPACE